MRHTSLAFGLGATAIFACLFYFYGGHQTPKGQPPLADLSAVSLSDLENEFNASHESVRILVMLSPT